MHCFNMDISGDEDRHGDPDSVPLHSGDLADVLRPQSHVRVAARFGCIHARLQHEEFGICGWMVSRKTIDENNPNSRKSIYLIQILSAFLTFLFVIVAFHDLTKRQVDGCLTCRSPVLHKYTGYTRKDVEPVMWMVNHMMHISRQQKFRKNNTVYSKYSHE